MNLNSRYHLFLTLSFYVKLAQKQIDDEIWQLGLFFFIKEYCNTTFLRLFVCQYFHENLVLFLPQVIKSGDDDFISPLSRITNVAAEHIWVSNIKKKSFRVLTVAIRLWFPIRVAREVLLIPDWSGNSPPISIHLEAERTRLS